VNPDGNVASSLAELAQWRGDVDRALLDFNRCLREQDVQGTGGAARMEALRERLASERLVVAFVAEFSRGKSELINALFFAGAGRRILPATPGRTTMCPVELMFDPARPPQLSLLPIETRQQALSLADLRRRTELWDERLLPSDDPAALEQALREVTRTQRVPVEQARALGFDEAVLEAPAVDGSVEVPAWRHAWINHPHPLLQRGLVVLDTPGLNAIGAEPELTLSLLPGAHATVFLLAADTGVTQSDLAIWREHLGSHRLERFVVLNKVDTLADPLLAPEAVQAQVERQREHAAHTLDMPLARVYALSARQALASRLHNDAPALVASGLPALETALAAELIPRQRELLATGCEQALGESLTAARRVFADRRRQVAEQLLELRGLRGKSGSKLQLMQRRLEDEAQEFEGCTALLTALRAVQSRMLAQVLALLSNDALRQALSALQTRLQQRVAGLPLGVSLGLKARQALADTVAGLRQTMAQAGTLTEEMQQMLEASSRRLNTEHGFAIAVLSAPSLERFDGEIERIEAAYGRFLGLGQAWRLSTPMFREQFRRMLMSKLRVVFENASAEVELWSQSIAGPMEQQLTDGPALCGGARRCCASRALPVSCKRASTK
jgi:hypothetical protein